MMYDDYGDYDDDDIEDEFLFDGGSDDDEYFMTRNGELVYAGDVYEDYYEYTHHFTKTSQHLKNDPSKMDDANKKDIDTNHNGLVAEYMSPFCNNPKYSDITLRVGPSLYQAHKIILCSWSEVFRKMFIDPSWVSPREGETNGPGPELQVLVEPEECIPVFKDFLKFMYTETVELNAERVYPILTLADKYLVQELRDACEDFLMGEVANISGEEALRAYTGAERLGLERVQDQCVKVLEANIGYLTPSCVQSMNADLLIRLLQSSNLLVEDEHDVYLVALQWLGLEGQQAVRGKHAEEVFSLIRFPHMPSQKLKTVLDLPLPEFLGTDFQLNFTALISKAFEWRSLVAEEAYSVMEDDFIDPRIYMNPAFTPHSRGSSNSMSASSTGENFRKLTVYTEDQDDYYRSNLTFRAFSAVDKNTYKFGRSCWEVSAYSLKDSGKWTVNYAVRTSQEIGHPYRVAILSRLTEDKDDSFPVVTLHEGSIREKLIFRVPSSVLKTNEIPIKVWTKMSIFIGSKKSDAPPE